MEKDRAAVKNYASAWWLEVEKLSSDNRIVSLSRIAACCITRPRLTNTQRARPTRQINKHCRESLVSVVITSERAHFSSESVPSESWRWYLADPSPDVFLMGLAGRLVPAQASKSLATISIWEPTVVCRHPPAPSRPLDDHTDCTPPNISKHVGASSVTGQWFVWSRPGYESIVARQECGTARFLSHNILSSRRVPSPTPMDGTRRPGGVHHH